MTGPALVTGGSGFVAGHVVAQLLDAGYDVRASVRDLANSTKVDPLLAIAQERPGTLELFEADLLSEGSFDEAMADCTLVFHIASPFLLPEQISDGQRDVVEPAVRGTHNVIDAVNRTPSVQRVVLTSTVGAIFGDYIDVRQMKDGVLTEQYFNTTSTVENNPYHYAKTVAEKLAWDEAARQDRWSMVAVNPGLVLGPTLGGPSDSGSLFLMDELMGGSFFFGAADFAFTFVDVRDVATAHVRAAERASARGRYILARPDMVSLLDMGRIIRKQHPWRLTVPVHPVPDAAVRRIGPHFGLTPDYIAKHLGIRFPVDNRRSVEELGIAYRPVAQTVIDHYDSWSRAHHPKAAA